MYVYIRTYYCTIYIYVYIYNTKLDNYIIYRYIPDTWYVFLNFSKVNQKMMVQRRPLVTVGSTAPGILRVPGDRECDLVEESLQSGAGRQAIWDLMDDFGDA